MKIAFYVSSLGFGHLTRCLALIEELCRIRHDVSIILKCSRHHLPFAKQYLFSAAGNVKCDIFESGFEIVFDKQIMGIDIKATALNANTWVNSIAATADCELKKLDSDTNLIVSDIAPEAFLIAQRLNIPSIAISNFTWYEICKDFIDRKAAISLRNIYENADVLFEYPLSTGCEMPIKNRIPTGLIARPLNEAKVAAIRKKYKRAGRPLVFFSIGRSLKLGNLALNNDVDYIYTEGIEFPCAGNAHLLPIDVKDTQNYIAACDMVITKCGWSTLSEAIIAKKPLFILKSSGGWVEENHIYKSLESMGVAQSIPLPELLSMSTDALQNKIDVLVKGYSFLSERYTNNINSLVDDILTYKYQL